MRTWPERLQDLSVTWRDASTAVAREQARAEIWVLLVGVLDLNIRQHAGRRPDLDADGTYDLAVKKALEIFTRFAEGEWDPRAYEPPQLRRFFAILARNAVIDYVRSRAGRMRQREIGDGEVAASNLVVRGDAYSLDRRRLGRAMVRCASRLTERARLVWFLYIFYEFPSRRIGAHPDVNMQPAAVDMSLTRSRRAVRNCLRKQGFDRIDFGAGVFAACWEAFRQEHGNVADPREKEVDQGA